MGRWVGIEVCGARKVFGRTVALRGVDVEMRAGRVQVICGANGSGKSTLLGVVGGVIRASGGFVRFRDAEGGSHERGPAISWVSHEALGYGDLTVGENFELGLALNGVLGYGVGARRAFVEFGLGGFVGRRLRECSRGQRQRVALARAVAGQADVLLLDEPMNGLDVAGVARLLAAVEAEVVRGAVVVVVTHDVGPLQRLGPRRIVLAAGRVERVEE